jgi:hypothetical protein
MWGAARCPGAAKKKKMFLCYLTIHFVAHCCPFAATGHTVIPDSSIAVLSAVFCSECRLFVV